MQTVHTAYGPIEAHRVEYYPGGSLKSLVPAARSVLTTPFGQFIPQFESGEERRRTIPEVSFHPNGTIRSLPLQEHFQVSTPLGLLSAELITFHDTGAVKRVFPLNGRLSGFWSQEDEAGLAKEQVIETPFGLICSRFISICFNEDSTLRSLTLWPGEVVEVPTPIGVLPARVGISFYPDGKVASLEPARPLRISTRMGMLHAFDPDAHGVHGDCNSLQFDSDGRVIALSTVMDQVGITGPDGLNRVVRPAVRESYCSEDVFEPVPMQVVFEEERVVFQPGSKERSCFPLSRTRFCLSSMASEFPRLKMPVSNFSLGQGCGLG